MSDSLANDLLVFPVFLGPLSPLFALFIPYVHQPPCLLLQFLFIFSQQVPDLFDGFPSGLNLVLLVVPVDGAFRTDRVVAAEAEVSQLFFWVVGTGVLWLECVALFGVRSIGGLGDGWRSVVLAGRGIQHFISVSVSLPLSAPMFVGSRLDHITISGLVPTIPISTPTGPTRVAPVVDLLAGVQRIVYSLQLHHTRLVQLGLLSAAGTGVHLGDRGGTGELSGSF